MKNTLHKTASVMSENNFKITPKPNHKIVLIFSATNIVTKIKPKITSKLLYSDWTPAPPIKLSVFLIYIYLEVP